MSRPSRPVPGQTLQCASSIGRVAPTRTRRQGVTVFRSLYVQVLIGIALGVILGATYPEAAVAMKPLGDGFI